MFPRFESSGRDGNRDTSRTLVLCFDGTANEYGGENTNVVKFFELLKKDNHQEQMCYYQPGIGTYLKPGATSHLLEGVGKVADQAVAWYLDTHVTDGYQFLMKNYRTGDRICLFGFSRGAYVARALAGFLHKIGLLPRDNHEQVSFAYRLYKRTDHEGERLAENFRRSFCREVRIDFVGVWDTVASVGVLRSRTLPFTASNTTIRTFRHALSLDEHRAKFKPNLYHRPTPQDREKHQQQHQAREREQHEQFPNALGLRVPDSARSLPESVRRAQSEQNHAHSTSYLPRPSGESPARPSETSLPRPSADTEATRVGRQPSTTRKLRKKRRSRSLLVGVEAQQALHAQLASEKRSTSRASTFRSSGPETDVLEVWFAGCHTDVGGGAVSDDMSSLADITLRWMVREVMAAQCGVLFDSRAMTRMKIPLDSLFANSPRHAPSRELALDTADAVLGVHDEMRRQPLWWLAEFLPLNHMWQDGDGWWRKTSRMPNLGRGRRIPDIKPNFHISVKQRMEDPKLNYRPKARWHPDTEVYVE